jgi:RNA polymerase sigma-70 factor (sigma-E family)
MRVRSMGRAIPLDLEEYVQERGEDLLRFAYLVTGERTTAEDLVQDVLCSLISRRGVMHDIVDLDTYLRRAVVNRRNSWLRRRARLIVVPGEDVLDALSSVAPEPSRVDLWRALLALPVRQRAALVLRFYEDMSYAEIARTLGSREGTARSLVSRGLAALRPALASYEGRGIQR